MDLTRTGPILCFGEVLLRLNPAAGIPLSNARSLSAYVGGAEANVAAALAQLGRAAEIVTSLPENALGDFAIGELRRAGIGTRHVVRGEGRMGLCFVDHGAGVRPSRITYDRADSLFAADAGAFDWGALAEQASWFHLSGITLALSDAAASAACAAVDAMRERGVPVSFDGNYRPSLWLGREAEAGRLYRFMAEAADVLFGSAHDIGRALGRELSGDSNQGRREAAEAAFEGFPNISVIASTRREISPGGGQHLGARVDGRKEGFETELAALGPIMDRIGSGDAFAGAVIDCLLRREPIERCARMGLAAAALKHSVAGDRWIGSRDDLERFDPNAGSDLQR